jgi:hypothetical protein
MQQEGIKHPIGRLLIGKNDTHDDAGSRRPTTISFLRYLCYFLFNFLSVPRYNAC